MNEEEIRDEARKAANRSQFMSNHIYDHKSYEDGYIEGMNQALRLPNEAQKGNDFIADVSVSVCQCEKPDIWMKVYEGLMCLNCMKPPKSD